MPGLNEGMNRRQFLLNTSMAAAGLLAAPSMARASSLFPVVRTPPAKRRFTSPAVEDTIARVQSTLRDKELAWMFGNCFPNTLDTTVDFGWLDGQPDTYVITGDINAMWLRDSSAQVWPYLPLMKEDSHLQMMIAGVIRRQTRYVLLDPYANAFYKDSNQVSEWSTDLTTMKPGVHERKWEVDSLCYTLRLAHGYWKASGDASPFDHEWRDAVAAIVRTFREQQRKDSPGPYHFQRRTETQSDTLAGAGYGNPARPVGMIYSMFRPSDDATMFPFLVPSNFFAVVSLLQAAEMVEALHQDHDLAGACQRLAREVRLALDRYAQVDLAGTGRIFAYEVDAYGNSYCIDDGNAPSLLSLPYLGAVKSGDACYLATRKFILSGANPYYCQGSVASGPGGPHAGRGMIWPLGLIMQGLTSTHREEVGQCLETLKRTHAGTGFMHEAFDANNPNHFTRPWFAWANTLFGELVLKTMDQFPGLIT